jgi:uncharacterized protein YndB with AHSA1/START domain
LISAEREIPVAPERVFEFLSDLRNHWRLEEGAFIALEEVGETSGVVRLKGPLGLSRRARTRVLAAEPSRRVAGRADLSFGTVGLVAWEITPHGEGSLVKLSAEVAEASLPDRAALALGGWRWLRRLFDRALVNLEAAL